jgi:hypothetical protein
LRRSISSYRRCKPSSFAWQPWAIAAALAFSVFGFNAQAQDPFLSENAAAASAAEQALLGIAPTSPLLVDPAVTPAQSVDGMGNEYETSNDSQTRPVSWISGPYVRGGVNFVLGEGIFDAKQEAGYAISGGYRQPFGPELAGDRFFFDLGGSYKDSYGETTPINFDSRRLTTISGVVIQDIFVPNAFAVTLEEMRQAGAHTALGWYWGEPLDNRGADPQVRVATRIGGRLGHARGIFREDLLAPPPGPNQSYIRPFYQQTDTYGGLFIGTEAILLNRQTSYGLFQWTVDGEFANDWINLGDIWDGSLGTASVMMGFMLSR